VIKRIKIRNFKSLRDVDLELGKINVIVGPNGSGKSNLVDFFIFLKELINPSSFPSDPFQIFGGYEEVVFLHNTSLSISFVIVGDNFQYSAEISGKSGFTINREMLIYKDFLVSRSLNSIEIKDARMGEPLKTYLTPTTSIFSLSPERSSFYQTLVGTPLSDRFKELFDFMSSFAKDFIPLRIDPERAFAPVHYSYPSKLEVDGYGFAKLLLRKLPDLPDPLKQFLDEINLKLRTDLSQEGNVIILAFERIPDLNREIHLRPRNVPAGFIKMITILFAMFALEPLPSLMIIDEIENSLHLKFIEELVSAMKYSPPQFIITTHSPMVIDMFDPEDIILFYKEKGETKAERIKDPEKLKEKLVEKGLTLSEWIFYSANPTNP